MTTRTDRGLLGKVVSQMVSGTEWGDLDYLIVDLPPGTG